MQNIKNDNPGLFTDEVLYSIGKTKYGDFECQSNINNRKIFKKLVKKYSNGIFCEIGLFGGINLFANYDLCKKQNLKIIGIDPHDKIEIFNGVNKKISMI